MLSEYGMECVWCVNFYDLFEEYAEDDKFMELAFKMKAFEKNTVNSCYTEVNIGHLVLQKWPPTKSVRGGGFLSKQPA